MSSPRDLIDRSLVFWQTHEADAPDLACVWIDALTQARRSGASVDRLLGLAGHARRKYLVVNRRYLISYLFETHYAGRHSFNYASDDIEENLKQARRNPNNSHLGLRFRLVAAVMQQQGIRHPSQRTVYDDLLTVYNEKAISLQPDSGRPVLGSRH